ncbi:MAG TPA: helix-turn-helix domain-containing protein [Acidimicrobiales bacterium]|nr:helix-turn-helix domain-containing protein [Acidimicrobiales bacterium]
MSPATRRTDAPPADGLDLALERIGDRWSLLVVSALLDEPRRFNELAEALPGIASNVLSQRLKSLEREGLVVARPYTDRPPRFAYSLTTSGRELAGAVRLLTQWGAEHGGSPVETPGHAACGTPLEARWYCPTCERVVDDDETGTAFV